MSERWSREQVLALAPDASSTAAAGKLAIPGSWTETGTAGPLVWGYCAGSGKNPYQTVVDLSGPAYKCSCPSRKFPCKHALALLLLWSDAQIVDTAEAADFAQAWLDSRATRAAKAAEPKGPRDEEAAAKRAGQRADRVAAGIAELELWLRDQVRTGLSAAATAGYRHPEQVAARMVDAQAPGLAAALRRTAGIPAQGDGWPGRLLSEYGQLHLLVAAHRQLDTLPAELAAVVRTRIGFTVSKEDVLATEPVSDDWQVLAVRDNTEATIASRRVWLRGARTGRFALLLAFAPGGSFGDNPDALLVPGNVVVAGLHFYPGQPAHRALVAAERVVIPSAPQPQSATDLAAVVTSWSAELAQDPWLAETPVLLVGTPTLHDERWLFQDSSDRTTPIRLGSIDPWRLLAVSGGRPVTVAGEWGPSGLLPLTVWHDDLAVRL